MHELVITGGTVVDGTGAPAYAAAVAVDAGRIVDVGPDVGRGRRSIDASGQVVAPGFIDSHTHLDAQLFWDPFATPSILHGVTTVLGGNCGFSVAPLAPGEAGYVRRMLARVEGMPLESLEAGLTWDWSGFGEWLGRLDGRTAVNAGFFVGHSTLRRLVMGERSSEVAAPDDVAAMAALLDSCISDGALGLTSSFASSHLDGEGRPVPSRSAAATELLTLAEVVGRHPGTGLGMNPGAGVDDEPMVALMAGMSRRADRLLNWNALLVSADRATQVGLQLAASDRAAALGGCVVAEVAPDPRRVFLSLANPFPLDQVPGWAELFALGREERMVALRAPEVRHRMAAGLVSPQLHAFLRYHVKVEGMTVVDAGAGRPELAGHRLADLAAERGVTPLDVLCDLAADSRLEAVVTPDMFGDDPPSWALRGQVLADRRTVIGAADAGAHLDTASSFNYPTSVLAGSVRDRGLLSLEAAVHQMTGRPAALFGLRGRGRVAAGCHADLVVFDPSTVAPHPPALRRDLPAGARRIVAGADGVAAVVVAGVTVAARGEPTGETPGTVLRSGVDTTTVRVADAAPLVAAPEPAVRQSA